MPRYRMTIAYDGASFHGWQRQPGVPTVQGAIEAALTRMNNGAPLEVAGASRTDAGVHAEGQVAAFDYDGHITQTGWHRGLNALTPDAITIRDVVAVDPDFHPRHHARGKHYRYWLWQGCQPAPRWRPWCWVHNHRPLDLEAMRVASRALLGEHDFNAFRATDCEARTSTRRLTRVDLRRVPDGWTRPLDPPEASALLAIDIEGNAFLKYMIRIIVGTLVEVGVGQRPPHDLADTLASLDRRRAGRTAPPQGLTLVQVFV